MILYLGLDPKNFPRKENLFHYPVIRTEKIGIWNEEVERAFQMSTHLIFTSQTAVLYFPKQIFQEVVAVGSATQKALYEKGVSSHLAPVATQEGIIDWIEEKGPDDASFFWPRSMQSRPLLEQFLQKRKAFIFDLYDTVMQIPGPIPSLDEVEEIVFTSPSTVRGFLQIYGKIPEGKKLTAIGPITAQALQWAIYPNNLSPSKTEI